MAWALLPVKAPQAAKSRLAASLSSEQRTGLAEAMRDDVAKALGDCPKLSGVLVLSPDAAVRRWGTAQGFAVLDDGGAGLNGALTLGLYDLAARGCERAVIIPSDVPLLSTDDLALLAAPGRDVRLARDQHGEGTNGLGLPLPCAFTPCFGVGSAQAHGQEAERQGLRFSTVTCPSLALDLDHPDALTALLARDPEGRRAPRTVAFLYEHDLWARFAASDATAAPRAAV
ncbi:MAG: 2-phospho-L-lactate guanylyltransferase [Pseudomonadales bacterium]